MDRNSIRAARIELGLCRDCGKTELLPGKNICHECYVARLTRQRTRAANLKAFGICVQCKANAVEGKTLCQQCMNIVVDNARERRRANKLTVIELYGGKCSNCGETDIRCLTIDHVNNDGNIDCAGKTKRITSTDFYAKLVKQLKRKDLDLLCANCHYKKDLQPWWYKEILL